MKTLLINIILLITYSIGSGQIHCSGPLNITMEGSPTGLPLSIDYEINHVFCSGSPDGNITLQISGGSPRYNCIWENGYNGDYYDELTPGTYWVTITDSNNCEEKVSFNIIEFDPTLDDLHLAEESCCGECHLTDGNSTFLYCGSEYFVRLTDVADGVDAGNVFACLDNKEKVGSYFDYVLHPRSFTLEQAQAPVKIDFFFNEDEYRTFADSADYVNKLDEAYNNARVIRFSFKNQSLEQENLQDAIVKNLKDDVYYAQTTQKENTETKAKYFLGLKKFQDHTAEPPSTIVQSDSISHYSLLTNPVSDYIEILSKDPLEKKNFAVKILTRDGHILREFYFAEDYIHRKRIRVDDLAQGLYVVTVQPLGWLHYSAIKFVKY